MRQGLALNDNRTLASYTRSTGWLGQTVHYAQRVGSTNDLALAAGREGAAAGIVVIAEEQTKGRGRLQRRWKAPAGSSLLLSMLFRPFAPFAKTASRITMICGLALVAAVQHVTGIEAGLKWPNDLIVEEREGGSGPGWLKLAGMLSEIGLTPGGAPGFLVVGIGLNVNVPASVVRELGPNATSLLALGGQPVDRVALLDALLAEIDRRYEALSLGVDPLAAWRAALVWIGELVEIRVPGALDRPLVGRAVDVDDDGALLVRLSNGEVRQFSAGDVSLRRLGS